MYEVSDYDFILPKRLIAQKPTGKRDKSRLLTIDRKYGTIGTGIFSEIEKWFDPGDVLVLNETKVIPARLYGRTEDDAEIEILLLREIEENLWEIMVKPGRKVKINGTIFFDGNASCTIQKITAEGNRTAIFECEQNFFDFIETYGKVPLPPYIERDAVELDKNRYQTVYAKVPGAVAAPTAGLHFTDDLLGSLKIKGVNICTIVLHVGAGTFKPIKVKSILDHKMHREYYEVTEQAAELINNAKSRGNKIFAVGTTAARTLETVSDKSGKIAPSKGETDIFIYPGYKFKIVDHLITNFHLPKSSLILLVSAFSSIEMIKKAYDLAIKEEFRFYSYGDAMLIL
ncbi:TPA: tRNA preQ1(34) S-adenosylmethionine ribosyltransferase-isomerase QueA [Candidatus Delongbacteria bacterium]|nr:MAG: tRNA preQ1(34) S-adenosylmethionine ribosyltransferase-isomerase QueA [Candidatus Delongbacteria bacterium GWF2_40_14]HAQ62069.1 tRNA preQ1(34) S-adenosylmethionine ribosyltransferase-isomerase QueA [Candidatus Delongbacteria bacterium]